METTESNSLLEDYQRPSYCVTEMISVSLIFMKVLEEWQSIQCKGSDSKQTFRTTVPTLWELSRSSQQHIKGAENERWTPRKKIFSSGNGKKSWPDFYIDEMAQNLPLTV